MDAKILSSPSSLVGLESPHFLCQIALSSACRCRRPSSTSARSLKSCMRLSMFHNASLACGGRHPAHGARSCAAVPVAYACSSNRFFRKLRVLSRVQGRAGCGPTPSHDGTSRNPLCPSCELRVSGRAQGKRPIRRRSCTTRPSTPAGSKGYCLGQGSEVRRRESGMARYESDNGHSNLRTGTTTVGIAGNSYGRGVS